MAVYAKLVLACIILVTGPGHVTCVQIMVFYK